MLIPVGSSKLLGCGPDLSVCHTGRVAHLAFQNPSSWVSSLAQELRFAGAPQPMEWGIHAGCSQGLVKQWLKHVRLILLDRCHADYVSNVQRSDSLQSYLRWQPLPHLHTIVYGRHILAHHVRLWGLARCGHHNFADGRSARHRGVCVDEPCRFCASAADSLDHALLECPAHNQARRRWYRQTRWKRTMSVDILFSTSPEGNTARNIVQNISYVGHVCHAAAACETAF